MDWPCLVAPSISASVSGSGSLSQILHCLLRCRACGPPRRRLCFCAKPQKRKACFCAKPQKRRRRKRRRSLIEETFTPTVSHPSTQPLRYGSGFGSGSRVRARDFRSGPHIGAPNRIRDSFVGPRWAEGSPRVARLRGTRDQAAGPGRKDPSRLVSQARTRTQKSPGLGLDRASGLNSPWTVPRGPESVLFVQVLTSGPRILPEHASG